MFNIFSTTYQARLRKLSEDPSYITEFHITHSVRQSVLLRVNTGAAHINCMILAKLTAIAILDLSMNIVVQACNVKKLD